MLNHQMAQSVIDHGISLGADFAELFVERSQTNTISTLSNQVQSVESGIDFGIGLRLLYGTKVLYGYTNKPEGDEQFWNWERSALMPHLRFTDLAIAG